MQAHDLDAPNLDTVHEPDGRSRLFLEDDPPISASTPSVTEWASSASAIFLFLFLILAGVGGALAWRLTEHEHKPTAPPEGFAELQQQLKSMAADLSAVRYTLDQQSAANHDLLTRIQDIQEQISQQSIALLSAAVSTQDSSKSRQVAPPLPPKR
jgi:hypothetical protein